MSEYLTLKEMSERYRRSEKTFRKYVKEYKIPHTRFGKALLFDPNRVALYLEAVEEPVKPKKVRSVRGVPMVTKYKELLGL